ncbi:unnamed protein product [Rotaria sordida]|uniref:Uncharacterized protein n=1 Tax=Rotaria sordida TaxID=392033 RepID=A0A815TWX5_9BILA|nr:unnamed protein product [Rotaria sordida]CAF4181476.1 unnamed protein product [Rotaria sordida]
MSLIFSDADALIHDYDNVQKKPLDDLKHSLQQIYGKDYCRIYTYHHDLSDLNSLKYTITAICEELSNNILVLINCAVHFKDIMSHTDTAYQYTFILNTLVPILITKYLLDEMIARNHGQIVNIFSSGALNGDAFISTYIHLQQQLYLATRVRTIAILPFYLNGGIYTTLYKW